MINIRSAGTESYIAHDFEHRFLRRHGEILVAAMAIDEELADLSDDGVHGHRIAIDELDLLQLVEIEHAHRRSDWNIDRVVDVEPEELMMNVITVAVGAIAGISLLVGAIGILTMMWIAVGERTAEIGLIRAVGASRRQVQMVFLVEAAALATTGGVCFPSLK